MKSKNKLIYYPAMVLAVFGIHYLSDIWGIEQLVVDKVWYGWIALFVFYTIGFYIAHELYHKMFK